MKKLAFIFISAILLPQTALAQEQFGEQLGYDLLSTILYSTLGIIMAVIAYKIIDWLIPGDMNKEIMDDQNIAASIIIGSLILGVCLIIAAVMSN